MAEYGSDELEERLYSACEKGDIEETQQLLTNSQINLNCQDVDGLTPLLIACEYGHIGIVELLLNNQRVDFNKTTKWKKQTPFYSACQNGSLEIVKSFLAIREINLTENHLHGKSAIDAARENAKRRGDMFLETKEEFEAQKKKLLGN